MEWIGKVRVYLYLRGNYYEFCWINLWKDGSLFFGFMSKIPFIEYGTAKTKSGDFVEHVQTLARGNINIKEANFPHLSFHPPRVSQKTGIVHIRDGKNFVDKWDLDWFPVNKPMHLMTIYSGDITRLKKVIKLKKPNEVVNLSSNIKYLRMDLILYPRVPNIFHDPKSFTKLIGVCPNYLVCCYFYSCNPSDAAFYAATEL